jgi:hypothetical protein
MYAGGMTTWNDLANAIDSASGFAQTFKGEYDRSQEALALTQASLNESIKSNVTLTTQVRQLRATVASQKARILELEAQVAATKRCTLPVWQTSVPRGTNWVKPGSTTVRVLNEVWNTAEAGPQTIKVCSASSWYVEANHPKPGVPADREGSVKSYPCTQVLFSKPALSTLTSLTSRWAHEAPASGYWNACYDIWLGGLGSASTAEIMIWTDKRYPAPLPPSNALKVSNLTLGGRNYTAWTRKNSNGGDYIALVDNENRPAGEVDLLAVFKWLASLGWIKMSDTLACVNYGIEISSTKATPATFWLNDFKLTHNGTQLV